MSLQDTPTAIPPNARCVGCGYSLYKLEVDRCPECGRGFDRNNAATMGLQRRWFSTVIEWLNKPVTPTAFLWPMVATLIFAVGVLFPVAFLLTKVFGMMVWIAFCVGHLTMAVSRKTFVPKSGSRPSNDRRARKRLLISAMIGVLLSFLLTQIPINAVIVFWLCHQQLDDLASRVPENPVSYDGFGDVRIGPYTPRVDRCVHWLGVGSEWPYCPENWEAYQPWYRVYFVLEDDPNYHYDNSKLQHLKGNWYAER